ncbi:MAG TPA: response regulator [Verrucomicrobiae bacterium]
MDKATPATILVIEDHDSVRIAISRFLKTGGFQVLEAATPEAARSIWTEHSSRIDLLLADIALQASSGPDLVKELLKQGPKRPVIFATAIEDDHARKATRSFKNPTILQKPFSPEVLVKAINKALSRN